MSFLSVEELKQLLEQSHPPCVSIYMPTVQAGAEVRQNPIRFKNLIRQAETQLQEQNLRQSDIAALLQPALDLDQEEFWHHQNQGLAFLIAQDFLRYYLLPIEVEELAVVGDRFHLKPLLPLLTGDGQFYVLTLNQQDVRLYQGSRYTINEVELEDVPTNLDEALQYDETAKAGQFRISTSKGGTNNSFQQAGTFHGQGSPDRDKHQEDILQFFHTLDRGLQSHLKGNAPLVLAGVEYLLPLYREANSYQFLLEEGIPVNLDLLSPTELHSQVWPLVEPHFEQQQQAAIAHYQNLSNTDKTSSNWQEAISAAYYGRIDQLFVATGTHLWGKFDPQANQLDLHADPQPGDEDLLDAAAVQTLINGGIVYTIEPDQIPNAVPLAAVFRY
jgi:hypothetical protein